MIIADNGTWRIRMRTDRGSEDYAITTGEGRFTFYLHGKAEKIAFIKALEATKKQAEKDKSDVFFMAFGGYFGIWLTLTDIEFLLANLPVSEAEKQISTEAYRIDVSRTTRH